MRQSVKEFDEAGFAAFWDAYPRHESKKDAYKAWCQLQPDERVKEHIHVALLWQRESGCLSDPKYCPLPASWIRGERWTDEGRSGQDRRAIEMSRMTPFERARHAGLK